MGTNTSTTKQTSQVGSKTGLLLLRKHRTFAVIGCELLEPALALTPLPALLRRAPLLVTRKVLVIIIILVEFDVAVGPVAV